MTIEETLQLAIEAHCGQKDLDGNPVILHPLTVGLKGENELEMKAGFLHDVLEDTAFEAEDLRKKGVDDALLTVLDLLTHRETQTYDDYIARIIASDNLTALRVKRNDLLHNLARGREHGYWDLVDKHEKAITKIEKAIETYEENKG